MNKLLERWNTLTYRQIANIGLFKIGTIRTIRKIQNINESDKLFSLSA